MTTDEHRPSAADAAVWEIANHANASTREQLALLLGQQETVEEISRRFGNLEIGQKSGHVFEWMHELTFNLDAIAKHDSVRARVTTWLGEPHAPDDLRIVDQTGETLQRVQAKVVQSVSQRLASHNGLSDPKYAGMERLIPSDHVGPTDSLLERRLSMPDGPLHARYEETRSHLTDHIEAGQVQSAPVSTEDVRRAAADPEQYLADHVGDNHLKQTLNTAGAAAAAGAVIAGASAIGQHVISSGSVQGIDWTSTAVLAAKAGAKQGAISAAANVLSVHAQHRLADGATGAIEQLSGGTLSFAIARGALDISMIAHGVATGRMTESQAAVAATESLTRTGAVWACAAAGQTLIPIPVVGAMVGGIVGQYGATVMSQGIRIAIAARDLDRQWDAEYDKLLAEIALVESLAASDLAEIRDLSEQHQMAFSEYLLPSLERLDGSIGAGSPNDVLAELARIMTQFGAAPIFASVSEFDDFMRDDLSVLELKLTRR